MGCGPLDDDHVIKLKLIGEFFAFPNCAFQLDLWLSLFQFDHYLHHQLKLLLEFPDRWPASPPHLLAPLRCVLRRCHLEASGHVVEELDFVRLARLRRLPRCRAHILSGHHRAPPHLRVLRHSVLDTNEDHYNQLMVMWYVIASSNHIYYNLSFDYLNFAPSDFCARLICHLHSSCWNLTRPQLPRLARIPIHQIRQYFVILF